MRFLSANPIVIVGFMKFLFLNLELFILVALVSAITVGQTNLFRARKRSSSSLHSSMPSKCLMDVLQGRISVLFI